jgi:hypothetical protein
MYSSSHPCALHILPIQSSLIWSFHHYSELHAITALSLIYTLYKSLQYKVKVTLRLTVSQSVSLSVEPHLGLMTRHLLLFDSYGHVSVGRPLWREDGSVFCICCWPSPGSLSLSRVPRLAGSRWRYSTPPPHGCTTVQAKPHSFIIFPSRCLVTAQRRFFSFCAHAIAAG